MNVSVTAPVTNSVNVNRQILNIKKKMEEKSGRTYRRTNHAFTTDWNLQTKPY